MKLPEMRKFRISANTLMTLLLIISVFIVLKFSDIKTPSFIPSFIAELFEKPSKNMPFFEYFRIFEALSMAYISAFMVYLVIEVYPKRDLSKKTILLLTNDLKVIHNNMKILIEGITLIYDLKKDGKKIKEEEIKKIGGFKSEYEKIYYKKISENDTYDMAIFLTYVDLHHYSKSIKKKLNYLSSLPIITNCHKPFLEIIAEINSSKFLDICQVIKPPPNTEIHYGYYNLDVAFSDFLTLMSKLEKYQFSKNEFSFEKMTLDEIEEMRRNQDQNIDQILANTKSKNERVFFDNIEYRIKDSVLIR